MDALELARQYSVAGPGPVKFLWVPGFSGHPWITATLSEVPGQIRPESMFGFINTTGDTLVTVSAPGALQGRDRDRYFSRLLDEITGPTIAVGLCTGAAVVNELYRRAVAAGKDSQLCVVLQSAPGSLKTLKPWLPSLVRRAARIRHTGAFHWLFAHLMWVFFIKPRDILRLYRANMLWVLPLWRDSMRSSNNMLANLRSLVAAGGFGPPVRARGHVVTLNLARRDDVMRISRAAAAARASYTDLDQRTMFSYNGTRHGVVEVDGRAAAAALLQIRDYCLKLFGLPAER